MWSFTRGCVAAAIFPNPANREEKKGKGERVKKSPSPTAT